MDILPYLTTSLKTQKEVSLNGFGTFFKTRVPGRYDEETQSYLPPFYTLNFKQGNATDDQLATYISESRHLSLNTITYYISEYVARLNHTLEENAEADLPGIGKLKQGEPDLIFEADPKADLGQDFFGLPPIKAAAISENAINELPGEIETAEIDYEEHTEVNTESTETIQEHHEVIPVSEESADEIETPEIEHAEEAQPEEIDPADNLDEHSETEDIVENQEEFTADEPEGRPAYIKWLIIIFILVVLAAVLLMLKPNFYKDLFKNTADTTSTAFDKEKLKNKADTLNADTTLTNKIKDVLIDSLNSDQAGQQKDSTTFEIVVAAESSKAGIKKMITNYTKMGFQAKVIPAMPGKLMQKISVATFYDEKEALDSLKVVRKKLKSDDPYVFTNLNQK